MSSPTPRNLQQRRQQQPQQQEEQQQQAASGGPDELDEATFVLPPGDVKRGRLLFKKYCAQCHCINRYNFQPSGCTLVGPSLYGIYGRTAGLNERTSLLESSAAMRESGVVWTDLSLMQYLKNPRDHIQRPIAMNFNGLRDYQDRVDLIWYLKAAGHQDWLRQENPPPSLSQAAHEEKEKKQ